MGYCWLKPSGYSYPTYRRWGYPNHRKDESNYIDMSEMSHDRRPNVGPDCMVGYKNSGVFVDKTYSNGVSIYFPYGLTTYFLDALRNMNLIASREKSNALSDIEKIKKTSEPDDVKNYFISNQNYLIKNLSDISITSKILEDALYDIKKTKRAFALFLLY